MPDSTTMNESVRTVDGTEWIRIAVPGANARMQLSTIIAGNAANSDLTLQSTSGVGTSDFINFVTGSQKEAMRIDTNQRVIIAGTYGGSASILGDNLECFGTNFDFYGWNTNSHVNLGRSNNGTPGNHTAVTSANGLGYIQFMGDDGTNFNTQCATIRGGVDGTVSAGVIPGNIEFFTNNSAGTAIEALRIDSTQSVILREAGGAGVIGSNLEITGTSFLGSMLAMTCFSTTNNNNIYMYRSRNASIGGNTALSSGDTILFLGAQSNDGTGFAMMGSLAFVANAAFTSGNRATRFQVSTGTTTLTEGFRIDQTQQIFFDGALATTASTANAFINNASSPVNQLLRSTSSMRYKRNVETVSPGRVALASSIRAIEFNSTCSADDPEVRHVGYAAEEVAALDPSLVHWGYLDTDYELETMYNGDGEVASSVRLPKKDAKLVPDGVMYDRILLLKVAALEARVAELEAR